MTMSAVDQDSDRDQSLAQAHKVIEALRLLKGERIDHAFTIGRLLVQWEEQGLYHYLGHATQDEVIAQVGLKRATALSNKRLALKFDLEAVRHLGVGKLRLLAANYVEDPASYIYDGIEVPGADGNPTRILVEDVSYRELRDLLRVRKPVSAKANVDELQIAAGLHVVLAPVLEGLVEATVASAATGTADLNAKATAAEVVVPRHADPIGTIDVATPFSGPLQTTALAAKATPAAESLPAMKRQSKRGKGALAVAQIK